MEKHIIEVNNASDIFSAVHDEWAKDDNLYDHKDISSQIVGTVAEALEIYDEKKHVLVIIYSDNRDYLADLERLNKNTTVPIIVVKRKKYSEDFIESLKKGATFYKVFDEIPEQQELSIVLSSKALIRRYLFDKFDEPYFKE